MKKFVKLINAKSHCTLLLNKLSGGASYSGFDKGLLIILCLVVELKEHCPTKIADRSFTCHQIYN